MFPYEWLFFKDLIEAFYRSSYKCVISQSEFKFTDMKARRNATFTVYSLSLLSMITEARWTCCINDASVRHTGQRPLETDKQKLQKSN